MTDEPFGEGGAANTPPFPRPEPSPAFAGGPAEADDDTRPLPPPAGAASPPTPAVEQGGERFYDTGGPASRRGRGVLGRAGDELVKRAERSVSRGFHHLADELEDAAARIGHVTEVPLGGLGARAEQAAELAISASGWLQEAAEYLRASDLRDVRRDLAERVRERPVQTLLLSAGAGWLLGKIVR